MSSSLSIIVPVFNEEPNLRENLKLLISEVQGEFSDYEIIIISDGSKDRTNDILRAEFRDHAKIEIFPENRGKGAAVRHGFKKASRDFILFIDGGMELHPKEIRIFVGLQKLYDADMVIGSKRHPQSQIDYPWIRRVLSGSYQLIIKMLFNLHVTDTQVGIKLFRKNVIDAILEDLEVDRYGFDLELLVLAHKKGFTNILEAPVRLDYFNRNTRVGPFEFLHIIKVGYHLALDTWRVYKKTHLC